MADLDGDDMCRCGAICTCGGEEFGEEYDMYDEADDLYGRQSTTACCPRQTIPDSCSCPDGCACLCADCDCGRDGDD